MAPTSILLLAFSALGSCMPASLEQRFAALPPKSTTTVLGKTKSTLPNIYRDGGGGGKVNGLNLMIFSDGLYTKDGKAPAADNSNLANFTSNTIAVSGYQGKSIDELTEFGSTDKGPVQMVPYFYNGGESDHGTGIWPNQGIATLCNGACGVSFPQVVDRNALTAKQPADPYNTAIQIHMTAYGPVVNRPQQKLFVRGEPTYGTFGAFPDKDGYLYTFAQISGLANKANGLKMARVKPESFADRSKYEFWTGKDYSSTMPKYDDAGAANIITWSQGGLDGKEHGPGTGDLWFSNYYGVYMLMFQADNAATDDNVYMSYSKQLTSGWSTPEAITKVTRLDGGYTYSFHAYPNYDETHKVIPLSWSAFAPPNDFEIIMANVTFA